MAHQSSGPTKRARYLRWPLPLAVIWLVAPVAGILIRLSLEPIAPYDYWWHLAMGKLIALSGAVPAENLFLYTLPKDAPFFDQPWLGQWLMYVCYDTFGHAGPLLVRNVLAAFTWAGIVAVALTRCRDPRFVGGLALLTAAVSGPVFGVRTQMFAFVPYVVLVALLFGVATRRLRHRWLFLLVPVTALWANLHGTFMLVPVLVALTGGSLVVERLLEGDGVDKAQLIGWSSALVAVALAAVANPLGADIYTYVLRLTLESNVSQTVTEWQPPDITGASGIIVMASLLGSLVVLGLRRKHVRLFEVVLFAATAYLAVGAVRQMFWWGAVMLMVVPRHLHALVAPADWSDSETSPLQGATHTLVCAALIFAGISSQPGLWVHQRVSELNAGLARISAPGAGVLSVDTPTRLVEGLKTRGYPGRIFHHQAAGGQLEFELAIGDAEDAGVNVLVEQVSFVDQRMEFIPQDVWDDYFDLSRTQGDWQEVIERYDIQTMLLEPEEQWRLIQALQASPDWRLVAFDESHQLFFRADQTRHITRWRSRPSETTATSR